VIDPKTLASWVSGEAQAAFVRIATEPPPPVELAAVREHYDAFNRRMLDAARARYPVAIESTVVAGVPCHIVTPVAGVRGEQTLLCLHGGAFMWGAGAGALLEAVPIAAEMGCMVVAVDYRLAPEHTYPAPVDDVLAVYSELRSSSAPRRIGIFGCSAGGMLTAQVVARLAHENLPLPGAIAMLHGTGLEFEGDLAAAAPLFAGQLGAADLPSAERLPYFATADLSDPLVLPGNHPEALAKFPPSLLVTATRDFAASACSVMHRRLLDAGVDARFVMFDGLGHAHHMDVGLPESRETFRITAHFFGEHLR